MPRSANVCPRNRVRYNAPSTDAGARFVHSYLLSIPVVQHASRQVGGNVHRSHVI